MIRKIYIFRTFFIHRVSMSSRERERGCDFLVCSASCCGEWGRWKSISCRRWWALFFCWVVGGCYWRSTSFFRYAAAVYNIFFLQAKHKKTAKNLARVVTQKLFHLLPVRCSSWQLRIKQFHTHSSRTSDVNEKCRISVWKFHSGS